MKNVAPASGVIQITLTRGEMAEWFKAHAWKACVGNTTVGSNPSLSASFCGNGLRLLGWFPCDGFLPVFFGIPCPVSALEIHNFLFIPHFL